MLSPWSQSVGLNRRVVVGVSVVEVYTVQQRYGRDQVTVFGGRLDRDVEVSFYTTHQQYPVFNLSFDRTCT